MTKVNTNDNTAWFILKDRHIFSNLYDMQFTTQLSTTIDAMTSAGCTVQQIYSYFQNIGINIYEDHIKLYINNGINNGTNDYIFIIYSFKKKLSYTNNIYNSLKNKIINFDIYII